MMSLDCINPKRILTRPRIAIPKFPTIIHSSSRCIRSRQACSLACSSYIIPGACTCISPMIVGMRARESITVFLVFINCRKTSAATHAKRFYSTTCFSVCCGRPSAAKPYLTPVAPIHNILEGVWCPFPLHVCGFLILWVDLFFIGISSVGEPRLWHLSKDPYSTASGYSRVLDNHIPLTRHTKPRQAAPHTGAVHHLPQGVHCLFPSHGTRHLHALQTLGTHEQVGRRLVANFDARSHAQKHSECVTEGDHER